MAHNGAFGDLPRLEAELGDYLGRVHGDTDSERMFALITKHIDAPAETSAPGSPQRPHGSQPRSRSTPST